MSTATSEAIVVLLVGILVLQIVVGTMVVHLGNLIRSQGRLLMTMWDKQLEILSHIRTKGTPYG